MDAIGVVAARQRSVETADERSGEGGSGDGEEADEGEEWARGGGDVCGPAYGVDVGADAA